MVWLLSATLQVKRQASRKAPRTYYSKGEKKGQRKTVQGGKHLSLTANYTPAFAHAVFKIWVAAFQDDVWNTCPADPYVSWVNQPRPVFERINCSGVGGIDRHSGKKKALHRFSRWSRERPTTARIAHYSSISQDIVWCIVWCTPVGLPWRPSSVTLLRWNCAIRWCPRECCARHMWGQLSVWFGVLWGTSRV